MNMKEMKDKAYAMMEIMTGPSKKKKLKQGDKTASTPANMMKSKMEGDKELEEFRRRQAARAKKAAKKKSKK